MKTFPIATHATLPDMPSATNSGHDARYLNLAGEGTNVTGGTFDLLTTGAGTWGSLFITEPTQDWTFSNTTIVPSALAISSASSDVPSRIEQYAKDGDRTDNVLYELFGFGNISSTTNFEFLQIGYFMPGNDLYAVRTRSGGTGSQKPLVLAADGTFTQLVLNIDGTVSINSTLTAATLIADSVKGLAIQVGDEDIVEPNGNIWISCGKFRS